jgi:prolyl oligopeptidase
MKRNFGVLLLSVTLMACQQQKQIDAVEDISLKPYPKTEKIDHVDTYFGVSVEDPYRWLEDDLSDKTKAWVAAENEVTQDYLSQIPFREAIKSRLEKLWNYERYSAPFVEGEYTYFYKNDGLQNQAVLYRRQGDGAEEVFLDPNKFSDDGTTSLAGISFSKDGSLVAYQISEGGSDWRKVIVLNATDKSVVGDTLIDVKFSELAWQSNDGFYYSSYDKPEEGSALSAMTDQHKLYFHKLNTDQSTDELRVDNATKIYRRWFDGG